MMRARFLASLLSTITLVTATASVASGDVCTTDADCDDGVPCTQDTCDPVDGCVNERTDPACCIRDVDCDDCNTCTVDRCAFTSGAFEGTCQNTLRSPGDVCGDDTFCNGTETCNELGECLAPLLRPCDDNPARICDEALTSGVEEFCVDPCGSGGIPVTQDGSDCNGTEVCRLIECVGGTNAGAPCSDDSPCTDGYCGGVTAHVDPPCGTGGNCTEGPPVVCSIWGRCCTPDAGEPTGNACSRTLKVDCTGDWMQVGDISATADVDDSPTGCNDPNPTGHYFGLAGEDFSCPAYGAGVSPAGAYPEFLGPVRFASFAEIGCSEDDGAIAFFLGDDYQIAKSGPGAANEGKFLRLRTIRWIGRFQATGVQGNASRYRVVFYDSAGNRIEDSVADAAGPGTSPLQTAAFVERPIIPSTGFVVIEPDDRFAPFARFFWATTLGTDIGDNDLSTLWLNGGPVDAQTAFPGTSGQLAFELVGDIVDDAAGACCDAETGACSLTLPWLCNGFFQGPGIACQVCENDIGTACETDVDCPACTISGEPCNPNVMCPDSTCDGGLCADGPNAGNLCDINIDCDEGETCTDTSTCVPVPPACAVTACCVTDGGAGIQFCVGGTNADDACTDDADCLGGTCTGYADRAGDCVTVHGASCAVSLGICSSDADCTGGADTCEAPCPSGSTTNGFGTSCFPQLCQQPPSGFDTCVEASGPGNITPIPVPPIGAEPVVVTFSGNNLAATFNDHENDVGEEAATCNSSNFNSAGTADRGWWHAIGIMDCAVIRVDFCGTFENHGDTREPQWANLWNTCDPCGGTVAPTIVGAQGGRDSLGSDAVSGSQGLPFCTGGDDPWNTYGPLPAGHYWVPVYSAPGGYVGPYQMHVAVSACPIAACCLPGSFCVDPGTQFLIRDGLGDPISCQEEMPCAFGSCETCALAQQPDCDDVGGFWNALADLPSDATSSFITDCGFGGDGACDYGSCCASVGDCRDNFPGTAQTCIDDDRTCCDPSDPAGTCMTRAACDAETQGLGNFVGGAKCDFPTPPCPACDILGNTNCQMPAMVGEGWPQSASGIISDLTCPPNGTVAADDFVPNGTTISSLCVWGFYHDASLPDYACKDSVDDEFRVRVFDDNNGIPGALFGESMVTGDNISRGREPNTLWEAFYGGGSPDAGALAQGYTLALDAPITGMIADGRKYWLEVANNTTGSTPAAKTCWWNWMQSYGHPAAGSEADGYSAAGANSGGTDDPAAYLQGASRYIKRSSRHYDLAFCLGTGDDGTDPLPFTNVTPTGACWTCNEKDSACSVETMTHCASSVGLDGIWNKDDPDCSGTIAEIADSVARSCRGIPFAEAGAAGLLPTGLPTCGNGIIDPGEQCDPADETLPTVGCSFDCQTFCPPVLWTEPGVCWDGDRDGLSCSNSADCTPDGFCWLTELPPATITNGLYEVNTVWNPPDGGAYVTIFGGHQAYVGNDAWFFYETTCTGKMTVSACPTGPGVNKQGYVYHDGMLALYHDPNEQPSDEFLCPGDNDLFQDGLPSDEGCNGIGDTGSGLLSRLVTPGEKWTIRVTNWGGTSATAGAGSHMIDVDCIEHTCPLAAPPSIHQLPDDGGTLSNNNKGRMLPVVVDEARVAAIQVEFVSLPAPYDLWNGTKMFARAPRPVCETGSFPAGPCPIDTYNSSRLGCTEEPFTTNWNALGVVNLWHEGIVPGGIYNVRVLDAICRVDDPNFYSEPTVFNTAIYGDTVGVGGFHIPVDYYVGISDALAGIATFTTAPGKPSKSRTELARRCISHTANIDDVLASLAGFAGLPYPETPSTLNACDSSCPEP